MDNSAPNKSVDQEMKINLAALRKCDEFVLDILETSSQVAVYKFDHSKKQWEKTDIEGSLFLYRRSTLPKFAIMIMNRLNRENLNEYISKEMEFQVQEPFLLYKNSSMNIQGIWFNNPDKCVKVGELIIGLYTSPRLKQQQCQAKVETKEKDKSILTMFTEAQRKYDENKVETKEKDKNILTMFTEAQRKYDENKFQTNENVPASTITRPQDTGGIRTKTRSKSLSAQPCQTFLLPAAVENEESLHDPCILRSSPLRPSAGVLSQSLPNSAKRNPQRQLFTQEPSPFPNQLPNEKVPFPLTSAQSISPMKPPDSRTRSMSQKTGSDMNIAASLMSPLAFKSTKNSSKDIPEIPTLTKEQLRETLLYLLEKDSDFLEKIHTTYLKNVNR